MIDDETYDFSVILSCTYSLYVLTLATSLISGDTPTVKIQNNSVVIAS